ncbi:MAG: cupin [Cyanobacteriota bacterium]|jgi:gentisate 1,2-dioxygenase|nr:cupin [Synechococcus sp. FGCU3]MEB3104216.1 cupin [Cyanobacteriota bacterium]
MTQAPPATKALLFDYRQAANPVRRGLTEPIPYRQWSPELHASGPSGVIPLDLSTELGTEGPATSPGLSAHFVRIANGEGVKAAARATSSLFFVLSGSGRCRRGSASIAWQQGDLFVLPAGDDPLLEADAPSVLYWVNDAPLLTYLGVEPSKPRFEATHYPASWLKAELEALAADPSSARSNRLSLLLANSDLPATRTVTHVLWAMFGMVPPGDTQAPHRHQSVALDLIIDCQPGCYTLVGTELNDDGTIRNPQRIDWQAGGAFITPPGHWHSHVNESGSTAFLLPIQDAGLQTYLRSLDIRFAG